MTIFAVALFSKHTFVASFLVAWKPAMGAAIKTVIGTMVAIAPMTAQIYERNILYDPI